MRVTLYGIFPLVNINLGFYPNYLQKTYLTLKKAIGNMDIFLTSTPP